MSKGTIVDATIIAAAPSTKNKDMARDPDMHQTRKGNQWYFGMKAHIGVDEVTGLTHSAVTTASNVGDVTMVDRLLHGNEKQVFGDAGYTGAEKRAPKRGRTFWIAEKRSKVKAITDTILRELIDELEHAKASVRARVEHPFRVIKRQFGHVKARYRGLAKNGAQMTTLFALANLWMVRKTLLKTGQVRLARGARPEALKTGESPKHGHTHEARSIGNGVKHVALTATRATPRGATTMAADRG